MHDSAITSPDFTARRATLGDLDAVLHVVQDSTRRMQAKGLSQWKLYLTEAGVQRIRRRVEGASGEEVHLITRPGDDDAVGVVSIEWSDHEYWGDRGNDGLAGYIHMLAVHRLARGTRLGERIVAWAERLIHSRGRSLSRLDCWAGSAFLPSYYECLGYARVGHVGSVNGSLLMEKRVPA
jgi:GNAT superfamily N-acetyltransferase